MNDPEARTNWDMANYMTVNKLGYNDHGMTHGIITSTNAIRIFDLLVECAEAEGIAYTLQAAPHDTGTDADAVASAHRGVPTGLISVPNRYMHSPNEMVALEDLVRAARLVAAFARRLTPEADFIPR